jgi:hypothetical protein
MAKKNSRKVERRNRKYLEDVHYKVTRDNVSPIIMHGYSSDYFFAEK